MEAARSSLSASLSWPETAHLLGLTPADSALPARLPCPLCASPAFTAYADAACGGAWFHCPGCGRSGDLIELAAAVWGMGVPAAVDQLVRLGAPLTPPALTPERVSAYIRDYPDYRRRLQALWQRARAWLPQAYSRDLTRLRAALRLSSTLSLESWQQGPGRLLGALPREDVEACFCPRSASQGGACAGRYRLNPSHGRVFRGPGWGDVLVVPYSDLPGRLCAFEFLGRGGAAADRVFRPQRQLARSGSNQYARQPPYRAEAGLAGLETTEAPPLRLGRTVFAVRDVALALRLQVRHSVLSLRPLPLVCWHDSARALTARTWGLLAGRPVVFWGWRLEAALLYQAVQADGEIALAGPEELTRPALDHYLRLREPLHQLRQLQRQALPWPEAVRAWAERQPDGVVAELLLELAGYRLDLRGLARACGGGRLEELLPPEPRPRVVRVGARTVVERADGWYAVGRGGREVPLINAVLRIDTALSAGGVLRYQGRVLFRGAEVPFEEAAAVVERHPARWLRALLLRQGLGVVHVAPGLTGLVEIALRFHEPSLA